MSMRTNYCGLTTEKMLGQTVTLCGWVHRRRDHGGIIFIDLRDREGLVQVVCDPDRPDVFKVAESVRNEFCLQVTGIVRERPQGTVNENLTSGRIEVFCEKLEVLNPSVTPPFQLDDEHLSETTRLTHRVLDLRRPQMQNNLRLRYKVAMETRKYLDENGTEKELKERGYLDTYMNEQAERSMRLLAVAKRNGDSDEGALTLVCVISIRDNVRMEAKDAIREVQRAGIQVVMVTGDRKETAVAIAKEAGLLVDPDDIALTSAEMAEKSDEEMKALLPHLRVVSRALPTDKSRLVRLAQELDEVVGMTGDGVNDSPALKKADVGFAMGSGTEVAKEAGDITILDDNFASIKKAILYGRTMFKSIRKFLIFQLTVNVAAVLTCFIGPLLGENTILTVTQLLMINLAMDTLAAIAFGSEPALEEYMKDRPIPRKESIITKNMMTEILIGALYITGICLSILFVPAVRNLFGDVDVTYLKSALFATFMMAITFNGFNARTEHINPFEHIGRNKNFLLVMGAIFLMQFVFVTFGGEVLSVERLSVHSWMICLILAFMVIPIDVARKLIIRKH